MRGRFAAFTPSHAASMSDAFARANPQIMGGSPLGVSSETPTVAAMLWTASKSPGEAAGKPASITSTPSRAKLSAMRSFSALVMVAPGDCSPSRRVVSKMRT